MSKDQLFTTSGFQFDNLLLGSKKFSGLSRNRPLDVYSQLVCLLPVGILILFRSFVVVQFHPLNFWPTMKTSGFTSNYSLKPVRHEQVFAWTVVFGQFVSFSG